MDTKRAKAKNFSSDEDYQLCKSWKAISEDAIHGTDQSTAHFWTNIRDHGSKTVPSLIERSVESLRQRFGMISRSVSKFIGVYASVMRLNQSGKSLEDKFNDAVELYNKESTIGPFKYRSCWELLKSMPKFSLEPPQKRTYPENEDFQNVEYLEDDQTNSRPMGQKQAKKLKLSTDLEERRIKSMEQMVEASKERNKLLLQHSEVLSVSNDVQLMHFLTMETEKLDPVTQEIIEIKKRQYLRNLQEQESRFNE